MISAVGFCNDTGVGDLSTLAPSLRRFAELGADAAEISLYGEDVIMGGRVVESRARELAAVCADFQFRYTVHGQIVSNFMDRENIAAQKAVVRAMLELCDRIGATVLVQHGGTGLRGNRAELDAFDQLERDTLAEMAEVAAAHGVRIALENIFANHQPEYRQTPAEIARTVTAVGHENVVGLIDFGHAYLEGTRAGFDWREQIRAMAPVTGHLHLHDNFGRPQTFRMYHPSEAAALGVGDLHLPLGWGDIPWEEVFDEITVLPGTIMILEIMDRFDGARAESLARARALAARLNDRAAARSDRRAAVL
jgi:sugar phosphate isomerase/epimerase